MESILDKVTYHAVYDNSIIDALEYAHEAGFAGVQIAVEAPHLSFERLSVHDCIEIADYCAEHQLSVSLHGPDDVASLFGSSQYLVEGIFGYFDALFRFAEEIGSKLITIHLGSPVRFGTDTEPRLEFAADDRVLYREALANNLLRLIDAAEGRFVLCVENYKLDPLIFDILAPHLESGALFLCWDLAKTYRGGARPDDELEAYFWQNISRVRQVHLHDIRDGHSHCVIGTGHIDFMRFLPPLAQADVLEYCIEVRPREKAAESLGNLRKLVCRKSS